MNSSSSQPSSPYPRVVCISLHLPDASPTNAGVAYLSALIEELGAANVLVIAPDTPMNQQSAQRGAQAPFLLLPTARLGSRMKRALSERMHRALPVRPEAGFVEALLSDPNIISAIRSAEIIDLQWPGMSALVTRFRRLNPQARIIVTPHDISSQRFNRQLRAANSTKQRIRAISNTLQARWVEHHQLKSADTVVVFSTKDQDLLPPRIPTTTVLPRIKAPAPNRAPRRLPNPPTATLVGPLSRSENWDAAEWMVSSIWPAVHRAVPTARLAIAGSVSDEQRANLNRTPGVEVLGFVEDLESLYDETSVVVAPIRQGAGVKFKVLDALMRGIPLVATSVGTEGIGDAAFTPASFDTVDSFARTLIEALEGSDASLESAKTARTWAQQRFGPEAFRRSIDRVYGVTRSSYAAAPTPSASVSASETTFVPQASVVIPVRNGERTLGYELAALAREPEASSIEVIISNNGSSDRTEEVALSYADAFGALRVVDSGDRQGVSHARNIGILHATAEKILICDADDEVRAGWIRSLAAGLDSFDVVGGRALSRSISGARALETAQEEAPAERVVFGYLPYVLGGCMGVRRSAALAVGGFDGAFLRGHEEVDFCWRLQQNGYTLGGVDEAILDYRQRDRARDAARQRFHSARTQVLLWTRHSHTGQLEPVSFKGAIRRAARSLRKAPRLLSKKQRFAAARDISWSFGLVSGHLRYRIIGMPPGPLLMEAS